MARKNPPITKKIDGKEYRLSAGSRRGLPKGYTAYEVAYLKKLGYKTKKVKMDGEFYIYAKK